MDIQTTPEFRAWYGRLKDSMGRAKIAVRIDRLAAGNPGDYRRLNEDIYELRMTAGPGYRVYYAHRGVALIIVLCGGDKSSQSQDIARAQRIAQQY